MSRPKGSKNHGQSTTKIFYIWRAGCSRAGIHWRLKNHWSLEQIANTPSQAGKIYKGKG